MPQVREVIAQLGHTATNLFSSNTTHHHIPSIHNPPEDSRELEWRIRKGWGGRGLGKREGIWKDTGESNQIPLCIPVKEPPPPSLSFAFLAPSKSLLPKTEALHVSSAKTEPRWLSFWLFWLQQAPLAPCPITGSHNLKPGVLHPNGVPSA